MVSRLLTILLMRVARSVGTLSLVTVLIFLAHPERLSAQGNPDVLSLTGKNIIQVQFLPPVTLNEADLSKAQPLKTGEPFRTEDVGRAIDLLYQTGWFDDIAVEAEAVPGGVNVIFVTKPAWFVGGVSVEGKVVTPPNRGQLTTAGPFSLGTPFHDEDINTAVESMKTILSADGLYEAVVTPTVRREPTAQQVFITFEVKQGKRAKYQEPVLRGDGTILSSGTIFRVSGWRIPLIHRWRPVTDSRTRKGLQAIQGRYQSKKRLTARVELEKLDYDPKTRRVLPTVNLDPGPEVEVTATGAKVSKKVLKRYVPVYEEKASYTDLLVEGKRNLQDYFQSQGYYDVVVDFHTSPVKDDRQTIEYVVDKGERYKLNHLVVTGNRYFNEDAIRERMFIAPATFNARRGRYSEAFRIKDEENIANLYKSNGFHDVKVTASVDRNYNGKDGQVAVTVNIDEGPQWIVDRVTLAGADHLSKESLTSRLASIEGQPFAEVNLVRDRNAVLTEYFTSGFPSAAMKAEWKPSEIPNHVNVFYSLDEGRREYVRDVVISGLRTTKQKLVDKRMTLKAGDPLSPVEQTDIQKQFYDLGVFARVDTAVQNSDGSTDHKYVLYNFEEANRYNFAFGLGAQVGRFGTPSSTSLSSPGGQTGFSPDASLDLSRLNFRGLGHTVSFRGHYSTIERRASISYLQPRFQNQDGRNISYSLLYENSLSVRTFSSKRQEASVQLSQQFSKSLTGLFRVSYRKVSVSNVIIPVLLVPQLVQPVRLGMVSANLSQDRRDNPSDPHRGIFNTLDIGLSTKIFGSQRSFGRVLGRNATYYRLTKNIVLARQTQVGIIQPFAPPSGISAQQSVPLPERFFGGGADSLRAFSFNQAGPRDIGAPLVAGGAASQPTGFPLGGNALLFNNVELRFPLLGANVQGVLFHDMGNVFSSLGDVSFRYKQKDLNDFNYMAQAAGLGVRYKTPVGPVRVDFSYALNPASYLGFSGTPAQLLTCDPNLPPSSLPGYCTPSRQSTGHLQFFFSIGQTF